MRNVVKTCALVLGVSAMLAGCGGGGGGYGGGGPVSPPPPPPPPPPPAAIGENASGGEVFANGRFDGDFRGPVSVFGVGPVGVFLAATTSTQSGAPGDVKITVDPASAGEPEVTITLQAAPNAWDDKTSTVDFDNAALETFGGGLVAVELAGADDLHALGRITFNLGGQSTDYSALFTYIDVTTTTDFLMAFTSVGADVVSMPSTGSASFDTGAFGIFAASSGAPEAASFFFGRGDVSVDFATGDVTGEFLDFDFISADLVESDTGPGGVNFGMTIDADVVGDNFTGTVTATGATMAGDIRGDFFGPTNAAPTEIGGAFTMAGSEGVAIGGIQGVAD